MSEYPSTEDFQAEHIRSLEGQLAEERAIVTRIWEMFGNPAYSFLDGRSIYDLVQDGLDAIQLLSRYREGHRQSSGQECYVNIEQGDYRCSDCIEADRLTGMERALRQMADERMGRLRASLAEPNNGFIAPEEATRCRPEAKQKPPRQRKKSTKKVKPDESTERESST